MKIGIVGGGAIGLLVAAYARKAGMTVTVFTRRKSQKELLETNGLFLQTKEEEYHFSLQAEIYKLENIAAIDVLFVAVKQYQIAEVLQTLKRLANKNLPLVFLQNGMGHLPELNDLPFEHIFVSIVEHGALKKADNKVIHTGNGQIKIGAFSGSLTTHDEIWDKFNDVRFPIKKQADWLATIEQKLLVNVCINPLTALFRVENGVLIYSDHFQQLMKKLFFEACDALELEAEEWRWKNILEVCEKTANNRSSMLRDMELGRETEIDAISGYVLTEGSKKRKELPYTTFVYHSIKGMEERRGDGE